jgi:Protein of unknown function (DUF3037)
MTKRETYSYTVLRYVHDVMTGEFVNIGVVAQSSSEIKFRLTPHSSRVSGVFPAMNRSAFKETLRSIKFALGASAASENNAGMFKAEPNALLLARTAMVSDDSSFQWSPAGSGITSDLTVAVNQLFERFVAHHEKHTNQRRSDNDVWKPIHKRLEELHVADKFVEKTFVGGFDELFMENAWKNGKWHGLQAYSLDMADEKQLKDKVRFIRGLLDGAAFECDETLSLNLILGAPTNPQLHDAYLAAKRNLANAGFNPTVLDEQEATATIDKLAKEIQEYVPAP